MLETLLQVHDIKPAQIVPYDLSIATAMDFSKDNEALQKIDLNDEKAFNHFVFDQIPQDNVGIGGYGEERSMYSRSELFVEGEQRTIHLGVDIWAPHCTPVYAPITGRIHSFDNRAFHGDYGPVIILEHQIGDRKIFSLYGHLSTQSLEGKAIGQIIKQGEEFAWLGKYEENFHWPPHLHFQLMWDMQGHIGDYPGVCKASEKESYLANCPNPMVILS